MMAEVPSVYMAGALMHVDPNALGWREQLKEFTAEADYDVEWIDPLDKYDGRYENDWSNEEIIEQDLDSVRKSDVVLVNHHEVESWGTVSEVFFAWRLGIPVVIMTDADEHERSPWMEGMADEVIHAGSNHEVMNVVESLWQQDATGHLGN